MPRDKVMILDWQLFKLLFLIGPKISSVESQKGTIAITIQRCSVENQKGAITIDSVQQWCLSGSQRNIFEY